MDFCHMVEIMAKSSFHHPKMGMSTFLPVDLENSQGSSLTGPARVRCPSWVNHCHQDGDGWLNPPLLSLTSLVAQLVKNLPAV